MKKYVHIIFKAFNLKDTVLILIAKVIFVISIIVVFFMIWRIYEKISYKSEISPVTIPTTDAFCILELNEVSPLWINWKVKLWDIRIVAGDQLISWNDINFDLSTKDIFKSLEFVIPSWVRFFASKRWKKLYNIKDVNKLMKMNVKNLIFFKSLDNARVHWYNL